MVSKCQLQKRRPKTYWIDELVMAYQDNPTEERFAAILAAMRQAILAVTKRMGLRDPQLIDEAMSDGWKGLWIAAHHWDRTRGGFAAYGTLVIMREMIAGLQERAFINKSVWRRQRELNTAYEHLHAELCRKPADEEVAAELGVPERQVVIMQSEPHTRLSLEGAKQDRQLDWPDRRITDLDRSMVLEDVRRAMQGLEGRSRQVLERRFFDGRKLREIAAETGLSKQRVDQIIQEALQELRQKLEGGSCAA